MGLPSQTRGDQSPVTSDGGASYQTTTTATPGTVPCFGRGTLIRTPAGEIPVERLRVGDLVATLEHGPQPIAFLRHTEQPLRETETGKMPVLIKLHALGPERPTSPLIVSPQHRVLLGGARQLQTVFPAPCLVAAKALVAWPGVRAMGGAAQDRLVPFRLCTP